MSDKYFKNTGKRVVNTRSDVVGIILREMETGQIQVIEKITPYVINTHHNWETLRLYDEE